MEIIKWDWDTISGFTQIITVLYLFFQFHILPNKERKDALFNLKVLFLLSRGKAQKLIDELTAYYLRHNCENAEFLPNVTFKSQLYQLHHLVLNDLNDDALNTVLEMCTSDPLITTAVNNVNDQIKSFTQIEAYFNTVFKFKTLD